MTARASTIPEALRILQVQRCDRPACQCHRSAAKGLGVTHCPAHSDRKPSLSVDGAGGRVLVNCLAGCTQSVVVAALKANGLWSATTEGTNRPRETVYKIRNTSGNLIAEHVRIEAPEGKHFVWRRPDGQPGLNGTPTKNLPLYGIDRVGDASEVVITEGEKAAAAIHEIGLAAVGTVCGASAVPGDGALQDLIATGRKIILWQDNDGPGQSHMRKIAERLKSLGAESVVFVEWSEAPPGGDAADFVARGGTADDARRLIDSARGGGVDPVITKLSDVKPETVSWLWPGRIPVGKITLLDGDPGLGKSMMTLDIAARLSRGSAMPDGTPCDRGGTVLMSLEDGLADTIRPRLDAAGADVLKIAALQGIAVGQGEPRVPTLSDIEAIGRTIKKTGARLIVIDPLTAYLPGKTNSHNDQEVRQALAPLSLLAEECQVAVVVIRHLNKSGGSQSIYRGGGSIGIIGAARCGLLVGKDPDDENKRVLAGIKSNLGKLPESISFHIEGVDGAARVVWDGGSSHSADALLSVPRSQEEKSALDEARDFLRDLLSNGPVEVKKIKAGATEAGISLRTLDRAKSALSVKTDKGGFSVGWFWRLPKEKTSEGRQECPKDAIQNDGALREENPSNLVENGSQVIDVSQDCQANAKMVKWGDQKGLGHLGENDKNPTLSSGGNNIKRVKI